MVRYDLVASTSAILYLLFVINREDAKTVNVISAACFSKCAKIKTAAFKFFLRTNEDNKEEEVNNYRCGCDANSSAAL